MLCILDAKRLTIPQKYADNCQHCHVSKCTTLDRPVNPTFLAFSPFPANPLLITVPRPKSPLQTTQTQQHFHPRRKLPWGPDESDADVICQTRGTPVAIADLVHAPLGMTCVPCTLWTAEKMICALDYCSSLTWIDCFESRE